MLGDEHPRALTARNNLAQTLYAQGDLGAARGHQEAVLEASRRLLGDEHPHTLTARLNVTVTLEALESREQQTSATKRERWRNYL